MMTWMSIFFQSPNSHLMELVVLMHDYLIMILFSILMIVLFNMSYMMFSSNYNLENYENHQIENLWTIAPFILLLFIVLPSLKSLYMLDSCFFCGMNILITGHQWYWTYSFKELSNSMFDSYMLSSNESFIRLTDVDNRLVIPNKIPTRLLVTSGDVLHSWALPSFGVKMDAVPGRLNQFCFSPKRTGIFFGQCSEICGANHSFMPIVLEVVSLKDFLKLI